MTHAPTRTSHVLWRVPTCDFHARLSAQSWCRWSGRSVCSVRAFLGRVRSVGSDSGRPESPCLTRFTQCAGHVSQAGMHCVSNTDSAAWRRPFSLLRVFQFSNRQVFLRFQSIFLGIFYLPIRNLNQQVFFKNIVDLIFYFFNIFFLYFSGNHRSYYLSSNLEKNTSSYRKSRFLETSIRKQIVATFTLKLGKITLLKVEVQESKEKRG